MLGMMNWMGSSGGISAEVYRDAARAFGHRGYLKRFLGSLARSEKGLAKALLQAAARLEKGNKRVPGTPAELQGLKELVEDSVSFLKSPFLLAEDAFLEGLLQCEYFKWNCLIALAAGFRAASPESASVLAAAQRHKRRIERFLESIGHSSPAAFRLRASQPVWVERLLVVGEFEPEVVSLLESEGRVELARHGKDAVEMLSERYYALVLSEPGLPVLDGIEVCKKAARKYPGIEERFLFMYDSLTVRDRDFITSRGIRHLKRPSRPEKFKKAAARILDR